MRDFIKEWGQIQENTPLKLYFLITYFPQGQLWQDANAGIDELCINNIALHIFVPSGNFKSNHTLNIYSILLSSFTEKLLHTFKQATFFDSFQHPCVKNRDGSRKHHAKKPYYVIIPCK